MKKMALLIFCVMAALGLSACGKKKVKQAKKEVISLGTGGEKKEALRTVKRTWTYYPEQNELTALEEGTFTLEEVQVFTKIWRPHGLKAEIAEGINQIIDENMQGLAEEVAGRYNYAELFSEVDGNDIAASIKGINAVCTVQYYGPYASISLTADPFLYNQNTNEYIYRSNGYPYGRQFVYHMLESRKIGLSDLFVDKTDYMSLINARIWDNIQNQVYGEEWPEGQQKEIKKEEVSFLVGPSGTEQYRPMLNFFFQKMGSGLQGMQKLFVHMEDLEAVMVCDPNDLLLAVENPEQLKKILITRNDLVMLEEEREIDNPGYETTTFMHVREYENQTVKGKINETLLQLQKEFANRPEMTALLPHAQSSEAGIVGYEVTGQFLSVQMQASVSSAEEGEHSIFAVANFNLADGELVTIRDLLRPDCLASLTEAQTEVLDRTNFRLDSVGGIHYYPADGSGEIIFDRGNFYFDQYASF